MKDGDHYVINGGKIWISNAAFANVFIVFVNADVSKVSYQMKYLCFVNLNLSMNSMIQRHTPRFHIEGALKNFKM